MVTLNIDGKDVQCIMINIGSLVDLLYYEAFKQMDIPKDRLLPIDEPIKGVIEDLVYHFIEMFLLVKLKKIVTKWKEVFTF